MTLMLAKGLSALLPVVAHLLVLLAMDGYKLVRMRTVLLALGFGLVAALASQTVNDAILKNTSLELSFYSPYVAPFIEESFKAVWPYASVPSKSDKKSVLSLEKLEATSTSPSANINNETSSRSVSRYFIR